MPLRKSQWGKTENLQTPRETRTNSSEDDTGLRPQEQGPDCCWKCLQGVGLQEEARSRGKVEGKREPALTRSGFFDEDREEMTWLSEMSKKIQRVCNHTEEREEGKGKGGRRKKLTKN